ncbi:MAG: adenylate kinase [Chloroflexi bacterium]|nr:adenylate kinase [Chloroflexota bacterium]
MRIVLLGPPGAGKGTQAARLAERAGLAHVATGDLFRANQERGTELGKQAKSYMDRGALVPDDVTTRMVLERFKESDAADGFVLDGFPRTIPQAEALDAALAAAGQAIDQALLIEVDREELVRRLAGRWICRACQTPYHERSAPPAKPGVCDLCGGELYQRDDDRPEVVGARLETYEKQTGPLAGYYERQGKLARIDGLGGIDAVAEQLGRALGGRAAVAAAQVKVE